MGILSKVRTRLSGHDTNPEPTYTCQGCGATFESRRQVCPQCGGYTIERSDW